MRHTFTSEAPQVVVPVVAPFEVEMVLTPPAGWQPTQGVATRLWHLRTGAGRPRVTEVAEGKVSGNGAYVVELSGYGSQQPQWREPMKLGLPVDGRHEVAYARGAITVEGEVGATHLKPADGTPLELVLGFDAGSDSLAAPLGWTLEINVAGAGGGETPVTPPVIPPAPPVPPVVPPVVVGTDGKAPSPTDALVADLKAVLLKHAVTLAGSDPMVAIFLQLLLAQLAKR